MKNFLSRAAAAFAAVVLLLASVLSLPEFNFNAKAFGFIDASDYLFDDDIIGETTLYAYPLDELILDSLENYYNFYEDDDTGHNDGPEIEFDDEEYNIIEVESSDPAVVSVGDSVTGGYLLSAHTPGIAVITVYHYGDVHNRDSEDERIYVGNYDIFTIEVSPVPSDEVDYTEISNKNYTGSAVKPAFKLTYKKRILVENEDYYLEYKNNVKVGTATVIATLTGIYSGVITEQFKILPTISKKTATVYAGATLNLSVKSSASVTWKTSNSKVATVNKNGVVTAVKAGTATITATSGGVKLNCKVTVKNRQLNTSKKSLYAGQKLTLKYYGGTGTIKWKSSNKQIATVNKDGVVTTLSPGTVTITATRNGVSLKCNLTVVNQKLSATSLNLGVGKTKTLTLKGAVSTVKWKTSDSKIVSVNQKGLVKGKKKGTAVITATHAGKTYKCTVKVK